MSKLIGPKPNLVVPRLEVMKKQLVNLVKRYMDSGEPKIASDLNEASVKIENAIDLITYPG